MEAPGSDELDLGSACLSHHTLLRAIVAAPDKSRGPMATARGNRGPAMGTDGTERGAKGLYKEPMVPFDCTKLFS